MTWTGGSITWTLAGQSFTATNAGPRCSAVPAPALAETGVILGGLLIGIVVSIAVFRERGTARPARLIDRLLPR